MSQNSSLKQQSFLSNILQIALPVALQSALMACLGMADVLMITDLGQAATAAVGAASRWHFVLIMVMVGLANAGGTLVAQYWGCGAVGHAQMVARYALKVALLVFIPITVFVGFAAEFMMSAQSNDAAVIAFGREYLLYGLPILLLTPIVVSLETSLRATGQSWLPLIISAVVIAFNILLNALLINGGWGVPAMGVAGAALATVIARVLNIAIYVVYLLKAKHWMLGGESVAESEALKQSYRKLAFPQVINFLGWASGTLMFQVIVGRIGTTELAVYSLISPFESLCHSAFFGLGTACAVVIGQSLGRSQFDYAHKIALQFVITAFVGSLGVGILVLFNLDTLMRWLSLDDPELAPLARTVLMIMACGIWVRMLNLTIIHGILRAGGENAFCLRADMFAMWVVGIPVVAYGAFVGQWDFHWVYLAIFTEEFVKLSMAIRHFLRRAWHNNLTVIAV